MNSERILNLIKMTTLFKQCNLSSGSEHLTAWLEADKVKPGIKVTLQDSEDPTKWWRVDSVGVTALPKEDIKGAHNSRKWFTNDMPRGRLKGISLKK